MNILKKVLGAFCLFYFFCGVCVILAGMFTAPSIEAVIIGLIMCPLFGWLSYLLLFKKKKDKEDERLIAEKYVTEKRAEADKYFEGKCAAADKYLEKKRAEADTYRTNAENSVALLQNKEAILKKNIQSLKSDIKDLEKTLLVGSVSVDAYENFKSDEIKNKLSILHSTQDEMIRKEEALSVTASGTKTIVNSQKKQILRCFNSECTNIISNVTRKNIDTSRNKIQRSFDIINKIFAIDGVQITIDYLSTKFEELSLVYAYMVKEDEEREQRKAIREQMMEEDKVRREIEREKQKIEKEVAQFTNEVSKLMGYMQKAKDDVEKQLYLEKIKELENKLAALSKDKENVLQREQNTRAGFVYIISNIGSFGENIYKIGMTRRLEPMDRINELSSASVPFPFDVHAMIFSDDAPALETLLHKTFQEYQVNKVNPRKEFFHVNLEEIKKIVLANHNATVQFVNIPDATEYRETLRLQNE